MSYNLDCGNMKKRLKIYKSKTIHDYILFCYETNKLLPTNKEPDNDPPVFFKYRPSINS